MSHLVQFQDVVVAKTLATDIAAVWFLACVCSHVHFQLLGAGEALGAGHAHIWLFARVFACE